MKTIIRLSILLLLKVLLVSNIIAQKTNPLIINGNFNGFARCITTDYNGNIFAAGNFNSDSFNSNYISKWDGSNWAQVRGSTSLNISQNITSLAIDKQNNLYAMGTIIGNNKWIYGAARWNGFIWEKMESNFQFFDGKIILDKNGVIYAYDKIFLPAHIVKWSGNNWIDLGNQNYFNDGTINSCAIDNQGNVYVAWYSNQSSSSQIAKWDGLNWSELGGVNNSTFPYNMTAIAIDQNGQIYIGGWFQNGNRVAKWNGTSWNELGGINNSTFNSSISSLVIDKLGNIYANGKFKNQNGYNYVAKWDGISWQEMGGENSSKYNNNEAYNGIELSIDRNNNLYWAFNTNNTNLSIAKYFYPPTVNSFFPISAGKGNVVTIKGSNFNGVTGVKFGLDSAFSYAIVNDSTIQAVVGSGGSGDISITNPGGTSTISGFTFIPAPIINSISPTKIGANGIVTINGENFSTTTSVKFGGKPALYYSVVSNTTINATVSNGNSGYVSVTTLGGKDSLDGFIFIPAPVISSFAPTSAKVGETVTIIGTNLSDATKVSFGGMTAKSFTILSAGTIQAVLDSGSTGSVSVTTPGGKDSLAGFIFTPTQTGLLELTSKNLQVYPNPAQDNITIQSEMNLIGQSYNIYDCIGKLVLNGAIENQTTPISLQALNNGIYTLVIGTNSRKVIKLVKSSSN